jgi:hypothetical protein
VIETTDGAEDTVIGMKVAAIRTVKSLRGLTDDIVMTKKGPEEHGITLILRIGLHDTEKTKMIGMAVDTGALTDHVRGRPGPQGT